jgi:para-aminobenzoate synthetase component I
MKKHSPSECFFYFYIMLRIGSISSNEIPDLRNRLIEFARHYPFSVVLDSNSPDLSDNKKTFRRYDLIAGFSENLSRGRTIDSFGDLSKINRDNDDWYLGFITYDVKNYIEDLHSSNSDRMNWPAILFFKPDILITQENGTIAIYSDKPSWDMKWIVKRLLTGHPELAKPESLKLHARMNKDTYIERVKKIKNHIARGDIYEINFCQEFYNTLRLDPFLRFIHNNAMIRSPFSAFVRNSDLYLLCFSPERFLKKEGLTVISQPIKGTSPRGRTPGEDLNFKIQLEKSIKERTENIMIVDLVRNDLSRIATENSVQVDELCGIYTFRHVHQMISSISATLGNVNLQDILRATFPMGSMTGAPKINAMKIIEEMEEIKRGLYSGIVGYVAPGMDFDFNVVIRSLQYNAATHYVSYMAGSAITALSEAENEYEECLIKAYAINSNSKHSLYAE